MFFFLPRRDDQIHYHSVQLVLGDLIGVDVVGRVDRLRLDSVRCLPGLEVHNEDQRLCVVAMPSHTLEHFNFNRKENGRYFEKNLLKLTCSMSWSKCIVAQPMSMEIG